MPDARRCSSVAAWSRPATNADRALAQRRFVTREIALARFKKYFANLAEVVGQLETNPFPPSFEIDVTPALAQSRAFIARMNTVRAIPGVDEVQYDWQWILRLRRLIQIINIAGLVAGGVLAIAAAFTIANVIRLTMMLYREEIEIMRLVGASDAFIRWPFVFEGAFVGFLGAVITLAILAGAAEPLNGFMVDFFRVLPLQIGSMTRDLVTLVMGAGVGLGVLGSWVSVRTYLIR